MLLNVEHYRKLRLAITEFKYFNFSLTSSVGQFAESLRFVQALVTTLRLPCGSSGRNLSQVSNRLQLRFPKPRASSSTHLVQPKIHLLRVSNVMEVEGNAVVLSSKADTDVFEASKQSYPLPVSLKATIRHRNVSFAFLSLFDNLKNSRSGLLSMNFTYQSNKQFSHHPALLPPVYSALTFFPIRPTSTLLKLCLIPLTGSKVEISKELVHFCGISSICGLVRI